MKRPIIPSLWLAVLASVSFVTPALAVVNIEYVTVGNAGNAADPTTGYGAVGYTYQIGKYEVTNSQYAEFLNNVAKTDSHTLYNPGMASYGISQSGSPGSYSYGVTSGLENRPVVYVSWFDAARFSNWLGNGQGSGDTETGAYTLNGATSGIITVNPGATIHISNENEWYKAAYYNCGTATYSLYPNGQNSITTAHANYYYSVGHSTDVGSYSGDPSSSGTFDQGGNVWEWNDAVIGSGRGLSGGSWGYIADGLASSWRYNFNLGPSDENENIGFRVASGPRLTVINVRATQRTGTKLVDIDYDITGAITPVSVSLAISADGGTTWTVPAITLTGAVGNNVTPGGNLRITWDAGTDWNNQVSAQTRFRVEVDDVDPAVFALVPAGTFTMGDTLDGDTDAPPHPVNVSTFQIQKLGVTKADWDAVRAWGLDHGYTDLAVGAGKAGNHPVQTVSWYDVVKWCNARSEKDGLTPCYYTDADRTVVYRTGTTDIDNTMVKWAADGYRLPTEAEREKAARGRLAGQRFPWGNTISHDNANFLNSGVETYQTGTIGYHPTWGTDTSPVGSFAANAYGLYDMAGNVWEWCWDWYGAGYYGVSPATDPSGPSGLSRVVRGNGWASTGYYCRAACRMSCSPNTTYSYLGFRPVLGKLVTAESSNIAVDTQKPILTIIALHGSVPGAGQYDLNTPVELTATPDTGYIFSKWTGDATGSTNPLSITMDSSKTITAVFAPDSRDPDGDGLTNYQEIVTYGTNPIVADTDGDGFSDGYEVLHGTSPTGSNSRPDTRMEIFTAVEVRFPSAMGQPYRIESSTDLQNWSTVADGVGVDGSGNIVHGGHITGTGDTITLWYTIQEIPKRYFRAVRE